MDSDHATRADLMAAVWDLTEQVEDLRDAAARRRNTQGGHR